MSREFASEKTNQESSVIAGRNAVTEALKKGRPIDCIYILKGIERGSMGKIIALAKERGIPIKDAAQQKLDILCEGVVHQGVAAMAACHDSVSYTHLPVLLLLCRTGSRSLQYPIP